jgi:hypothetical protein
MTARSLLRSFIGVVVIAVSFSTAVAQSTDRDGSKPEKKSTPASVIDERTPPGHLEKLDMPPGRPASERGRTSPPGRVSRDGYVSVQVNTDEFGNNIVGDAANEPSIAVDPTDPRNIVIGWRQFDTIESNFRQAGWAYSHDGGRSWTFPGVIDPGVFRSDPVLDVDADGVFYYNSLTTDGFDYWCRVFRSFDAGMTWDEGTYAYGGDKQWMAIDRTDGIGRGNIYANWNFIFSTCNGDMTISYDAGDSFEPCINVPTAPRWGTVIVGPEGEVYIAGESFVVIKSSTLQDPNENPAWDFNVDVNLGGFVQFSAGPNPGGLLGQAWIDVDRSGGPQHGWVYLLCSVDPPGSDPMDVMFSRSTDGGLTWSAPVRVNDDIGTTAWQWFGTMSVAPNGRIDAIWNDTRHDPGGYDSELYYSFSEDGGVTWSENVALTPAFDPHVGWPQQDKIGDYYHMRSDDHGADLAYSATFNGEQDVYYLRIGDACFDAGTMNLDRGSYACESSALLVVNDCGLNTDDLLIETVDIPVTSDSEPGGELVTLTETFEDSGVFEGEFSMSETDADGVLLVAAGDTVTATYIDADNGEGGFNIEVTATAIVDCSAPLISNVEVTDTGPFSATIEFQTDEPARGTVRYGSSCDELTESADEAGLDTTHAIEITGLLDDETYYVAVDAEDEAGNSATDDNGGLCYSFTTTDVPLYFTELFEGDNDLENVSFVFTPGDPTDFYDGCVHEITELPTDPAGGTTLPLGDDDSEFVPLDGDAEVSIYGEPFDHIYVSSNGMITFVSGDSDYTETFVDHFSEPRVSALFDDLNPSSGGTVSWRQLADHVAVTWENVPEYFNTGANTFQVELFFNGKITLSYLSITADDGLVGLSGGGGIPPGFIEIDLTSLADCSLCPSDLNDDDLVNVLDLLIVLDQWGLSGVPSDINEDGIVNVLDLLRLLDDWGPCPQ